MHQMISKYRCSSQSVIAFLNSRFGTSLFGVAALAASAWIALHARQYPDESSPSWRQIAGGCIIALNLVAILACVRELDTAWSATTGNPEAELQRSLAVSAFLMLYGAALLAVGFWKSGLDASVKASDRRFEPRMPSSQARTLRNHWNEAVSRTKNWESVVPN